MKKLSQSQSVCVQGLYTMGCDAAGVVFRGHAESRPESGQSLVEFSLLAPLVLVIMALVFTGSQYMNQVVGLNGAARAGAIVAANAALANATTSGINAAATTAVNQEQGCSCFTAVANRASCNPGMNCVWTVASKSPNNTPIEIVHVSFTVTSYLQFISNLSVTAQAGATA